VRADDVEFFQPVNAPFRTDRIAVVAVGLVEVIITVEVIDRAIPQRGRRELLIGVDPGAFEIRRVGTTKYGTTDGGFYPSSLARVPGNVRDIAITKAIEALGGRLSAVL
jgi:hypothetical protein